MVELRSTKMKRCFCLHQLKEVDEVSADKLKRIAPTIHWTNEKEDSTGSQGFWLAINRTSFPFINLRTYLG
jgi:hypothetical protein